MVANQLGELVDKSEGEDDWGSAKFQVLQQKYKMMDEDIWII